MTLITKNRSQTFSKLLKRAKPRPPFTPTPSRMWSLKYLIIHGLCSLKVFPKEHSESSIFTRSPSWAASQINLAFALMQVVVCWSVSDKSIGIYVSALDI